MHNILKKTFMYSTICIILAGHTEVGAIVNEDVKLPGGVNSVECMVIVLQGDQVHELSVPEGGLFNPFQNANHSIGYVHDLGVTHIRYCSRDNTRLTRDEMPEKGFHFGYASAFNVGEVTKYWENYLGEGEYEKFYVPVADISYSFNIPTGQTEFRVTNLGIEEINMSEFGYLAFTTPQPLALLNRNDMPPATFLSIAGLNGYYAAGESRSWLVDGLDISNFVVGYGTSQFAGQSVLLEYGTQTVGTWSGVTLANVSVPEPASWALMIVGFGAIGISLRRRANSGKMVSP